MGDLSCDPSEQPCELVGPFRYCPVKGCGWTEPQPPPTGAQLISAERERQINVEGWTPEHDDEHDGAEPDLPYAAICYAVESFRPGHDPEAWPWAAEYWKPANDPIRNLVKAGALIAAEIDRLQRKVAS